MEDMVKRLERFSGDLKTRGMRTALVGYIGPLKKAIKSRIDSRTGALKKSIGHRSFSKREKAAIGFGPDKLVMAIGSTRKVFDKNTFKNQMHNHKLHWLDEGVDEHEIKPKKPGGRLKIGRSVFARHATHRGFAPRRILDKSLRSSRAQSIASFDRAIERFINKHA
jgi:hypothetical protein